MRKEYVTQKSIFLPVIYQLLFDWNEPMNEKDE
jgi:hypothetical protein